MYSSFVQSQYHILFSLYTTYRNIRHVSTRLRLVTNTESVQNTVVYRCTAVYLYPRNVHVQGTQIERSVSTTSQLRNKIKYFQVSSNGSFITAIRPTGGSETSSPSLKQLKFDPLPVEFKFTTIFVVFERAQNHFKHSEQLIPASLNFAI